ncbi:hypothetical protein CDAR_507151 [Caerostris darwini]|uniref:Uncharacterized protein n=1 Tax=Caerostris darwini TaxID=1538125 RepID=A0AAV4S2G1_9ARAC|nr:hypothetical protein CDAR_507151 [Caerostris darwini]
MTLENYAKNVYLVYQHQHQSESGATNRITYQRRKSKNRSNNKNKNIKSSDDNRRLSPHKSPPWILQLLHGGHSRNAGGLHLNSHLCYTMDS